MIIDEILDRRDGISYDAEYFRNYVLDYFADPSSLVQQFFINAFNEQNDVVREIKVKQAIVLYIILADYNIDIIPFVLSVEWT